MLRQVLKSARQVLENIFKCFGKCSKIFLMLRQVLKSARQVLKNMFKGSTSVQKYFYASASAQIRSASARKYL